MISDLRFMKIADQHYSPMKLHSNFLKMNVLEIYQKMMTFPIWGLGMRWQIGAIEKIKKMKKKLILHLSFDILFVIRN